MVSSGHGAGDERRGRRVLAFGTFDVLHAGHQHFLEQARALGDSLLVVVARDSQAVTVKGLVPQQSEQERLVAVRAVAAVAAAELGDEWPAQDPYRLLEALDFDVLVLGYDQTPDDDTVRRELAKRGKEMVRIVRLDPHEPDHYKSSLLRNGAG